MKQTSLQTKSNNNLDNLPLGPLRPVVEKAGNALADVLSDLIDDIFGKDDKKRREVDSDGVYYTSRRRK